MSGLDILYVPDAIRNAQDFNRIPTAYLDIYVAARKKVEEIDASGAASGLNPDMNLAAARERNLSIYNTMEARMRTALGLPISKFWTDPFPGQYALSLLPAATPVTAAVNNVTVNPLPSIKNPGLPVNLVPTSPGKATTAGVSVTSPGLPAALVSSGTKTVNTGPANPTLSTISQTKTNDNALDSGSGVTKIAGITWHDVWDTFLYGTGAKRAAMGVVNGGKTGDSGYYRLLMNNDSGDKSITQLFIPKDKLTDASVLPPYTTISGNPGGQITIDFRNCPDVIFHYDEMSETAPAVNPKSQQVVEPQPANPTINVPANLLASLMQGVKDIAAGTTPVQTDVKAIADAVNTVITTRASLSDVPSVLHPGLPNEIVAAQALAKMKAAANDLTKVVEGKAAQAVSAAAGVTQSALNPNETVAQAAAEHTAKKPGAGALIFAAIVLAILFL